MQLAIVTGSLFATRKNAHLEGTKMLVVREITPHGDPVGPSFIAVDRVDAGVGDLILVNDEGSSARLMFGNDEIPVKAVVVAVVDALEV